VYIHDGVTWIIPNELLLIYCWVVTFLNIYTVYEPGIVENVGDAVITVLVLF